MESRRRLDVRFLWGAVAVAVALLASAGVAIDRAQQAPQSPAIRVEVKQVLVPVIVTDRKGRYLRNLTEKDFRIFDDGVEQKIAAFSGTAAAASQYFRPQNAEAGVKLPERWQPASKPAVGAHNTYLICLDTLNSTFSNYGQVRRALLKLFQREPASGARYALLTLGRNLEIVHNLTSDSAAILAALRERKLAGAITGSEAPQRAREKTELLAMLSRYCQRCDCTTGKNPASNENQCRLQWTPIEEWAAARAEQRARLTRDFVLNLRGLVESLGEIAGRRTIILVSDGFNAQPGREIYSTMAAYTRAQSVLIENSTPNIEPELRRVVRAAQRRDVSFYTLDSRGLYVVPATGLEINQPVIAPFPGQNTGTRMGATASNLSSNLQTAESENQGPLQELAEGTGGRFFGNSNDFLGDFQRALEDGQSYYLLAYVPTSVEANGKFHRIRVEVDRKRAKVRAKKGYWAPLAAPKVPPAAPATATIPHPAEINRAATPPPPPRAPKPEARSPAPRAASHPSRPASPSLYAPGMGPGGVRSMVRAPLATLLNAVPKLRGLDPSESQEPLGEILSKAGREVEKFARSITRLSSREEVTEEQLRPDGRVRRKLREKFEYLVLAQPAAGTIDLQEYRTDASGHPAQPHALRKGFMMTSGAFSSALFLLPANQRAYSFRYLGREKFAGRLAWVVAFAERPSSASESGRVRDRAGNRAISMLLQGIAWIDAENYRLLSLHTEMRATQAQQRLKELTTEIHYHEVYFHQPAVSLWLPDDIVVTASLRGHVWRNEYHYSDFKMFSVHSQVKP